MEIVDEFMTEKFEENPDYFVKLKSLWRRFYNTEYYLKTSKSNRKRKNDEMKQREFIKIVKETYPHLYKNHWKYGHCFVGYIKSRRDSVRDVEIYYDYTNKNPMYWV